MSTQGILVYGDNSTTGLHGTAGDDGFDGSAIAETFYTGLGDDVVYAGAGNDVVWADLGNDWLDGGTGTDALWCYFVDTSTSGHLEVASFGVSIDLTKHKQDLGYFGIKTIYNFEDLGGTAQADHLSGDAGANYFEGDDGNDVLTGRGGNDRLNGGLGADTVTGGAGTDTLCGFFDITTNDDGARDVFKFTAISDSTPDTNRDIVWAISRAVPRPATKLI